MTDEEKRNSLTLRRLKQAEESLEEAHLLKEHGKSLRAVVNRLHYAMFYAVLALLIYEPYSSSKHSGVLSYFEKRFVRDNVFSKELGRSFREAFELRQKGDYQEYFNISPDQVEPLMRQARIFLDSIKNYCEERHGIRL